MGLALLLTVVDLFCEVKPNLRREVLETNMAGARSDWSLRGTRNSFSNFMSTQHLTSYSIASSDLYKVARPVGNTQGDS